MFGPLAAVPGHGHTQPVLLTHTATQGCKYLCGHCPYWHDSLLAVVARAWRLTSRCVVLSVVCCAAVDFELNLCDVQPGVLGGAQEEFLYVGRLDNLGSCYTALEVRWFSRQHRFEFDERGRAAAMQMQHGVRRGAPPPHFLLHPHLGLPYLVVSARERPFPACLAGRGWLDGRESGAGSRCAGSAFGNLTHRHAVAHLCPYYACASTCPCLPALHSCLPAVNQASMCRVCFACCRLSLTPWQLQMRCLLSMLCAPLHSLTMKKLAVTAHKALVVLSCGTPSHALHVCWPR